MPLGEAASFDEPKMGDPSSVLKYRLAVGLIAYENGTRCLHTKHLPFREFLFSSQFSVAPVNAYEATELNAEISNAGHQRCGGFQQSFFRLSWDRSSSVSLACLAR